MVSRRSLLLGAAGAAGAAVLGTGLGVEQGMLPGRPALQARLGLNGEAGVIPDVAPGPVVSGSFRSEHRLGAETGWSLLLPGGTSSTGVWPLVVALHGRHEDHTTLTGPEFGLDRFLAAAIRDGVPPFAIATVDGGSTYWHPRPDGEDAGAMVTDELVPMLARHGVITGSYGLLGWSMGGYGALHLADPERTTAVVASSPALWSDPSDASRSGFADAEEYERFDVAQRRADLARIALRVDCGTGDPFYRAVQDFTDGFPDDENLVSTFEPGAHDPAYWRRMLPVQLAFLGNHGPGRHDLAE